jgi:hypothetical protein
MLPLRIFLQIIRHCEGRFFQPATASPSMIRPIIPCFKKDTENYVFKIGYILVFLRILNENKKVCDPDKEKGY